MPSTKAQGGDLARIGVEAAGKSLEDVAKPLTAHEGEEETEAPA